MFATDSDFDVDEDFFDSMLTNEHHQPTVIKTDKNSFSLQNNLTSSCISYSIDNFNLEKRAKGFQRNLTETDYVAIDVPTSSHSPANLNKNCNLSSPIVRKFPGPAGILPEKKNSLQPKLNLSKHSQSYTNVNNRNKEQLNDQARHTILEAESWKSLLIDVCNMSPNHSLIENINIKSIKEKASSKLLVSQKIPLLAVILQDLSLSSDDPYINLCDHTGNMNGTLHRDVLKQYAEELVPSCALLLRNIGVLSFGVKTYKNHHYLNITHKNLISIYSQQEGIVKITNINTYNGEEISKSIYLWHSNTTPHTEQVNSTNQSPQQLFSSSFRSKMNSPKQNPTTLCQNPRTTSSPLTPKCSVNSGNSNQCFSNQRQSNIVQSNSTSSISKQTSCVQNVLNNCQMPLRDSSTILNLFPDISNHLINTETIKQINSSVTISGSNNKSDSVVSKMQNCSSFTSNCKNKLSKFCFKEKIDVHSSNKNNINSCVSFSNLENSNNLKILSNSVPVKNKFKLNQIEEEPSKFNIKKPRTENFKPFCENNLNLLNDDIYCDMFKDSLANDEFCVNNFGCIKNKSVTEESDFEQSQVDSMLEGLDASSFLDDEFF